VEKNKGIVLKTYQPYKCKLSILDMHVGKIMAVPNRDGIGNGACISYQIDEQPHIYFIRDINIIDMPMALAKDDILFVHHILELCYYFIPMGSTNPRIFPLLVKLYESPHIFQDTLLKKIFLFKCFTTLGLYPESKKFQQHSFLQLAATSIDNLTSPLVDLTIEKELDDWLLHCISSHPCIGNFKTVNFLHENRNL